MITIKTHIEYNNESIQLDLGDLTQNNVCINGVDYYMYPLNPSFPDSKGANSHVFALYEAQQYEDGSDNTPQMAIKISKTQTPTLEPKHRFNREIEALLKCKENRLRNIINIDIDGKISFKVTNKKGVQRDVYFRFYTMEYAEVDLKSYLEENNDKIDIIERISLCIEIANGIKQLNEIEIYHRDIKPDNILMTEDYRCKIGDLGLMAYRDQDYDRENEFIGPKGWISPEAMNKYIVNRYNRDKFTCIIDHKSDIFQLGKLFWFIFQGNVPIGNISLTDFKVNDSSLYGLLKYMLNHSKEKRPNDINYVIQELNRISLKYSRYNA